MCVLTRGGGASRAGVLGWAPSFHVEGAGSHEVLHALHLGEASRYRRASFLSTRERDALITNSSAGWREVFSYSGEKKSAGGVEEEEDWRAINTICVDMCVCECVDACLCPGTTYRGESLDAVRRVLGLSDLCRAKDAFEAG